MTIFGHIIFPLSDMRIGILLWCCLLASTATAQIKPKIQMLEKTRILFVLDASGSMNAQWEGKSRMDIAKKVLTDLVDSLRFTPNLELGLRVYGHQFDAKAKNCKDSKLEVAFGAGSHQQIRTKLAGLTPKGTTPMAYSLEQATKDFPDDRSYRNVIVMITDGIEACGGDPCAISLGLQKKNVFLRPFIIGMGIEPKYANAFECMGRFYNAQNINDFKGFLGEVVRQTLGKTTVTVELLDVAGQMREKDVNVSFVNRVTGETIYDYVHYRDPKGKADSIQVDAILTYDIVVNTVPAAILEDVEIKGGRHNVIKIKSPQGHIRIAQKGSSQYGGQLKVIVRRKGELKTLHIQNAGSEEPYLVGSYDIEVLTLPRTYFSGVNVRQDETTTLTIEQPGILNVVNNLKGFGSLYKLNPDGSQEWFYNFENNDAKLSTALQPGSYKLVFRAESAQGSEYTYVKKFDIVNGSTVTIDLFK